MNDSHRSRIAPEVDAQVDSTVIKQIKIII